MQISANFFKQQGTITQIFNVKTERNDKRTGNYMLDGKLLLDLAEMLSINEGNAQ